MIIPILSSKASRTNKNSKFLVAALRCDHIHTYNTLTFSRVCLFFGLDWTRHSPQWSTLIMDVLSCVGFLCMFFRASGEFCNQTPHRSSEGNMVASVVNFDIVASQQKVLAFSGPLSVCVKPVHCPHVCMGFLRVLQFPPTLNQSINNQIGF